MNDTISADQLDLHGVEITHYFAACACVKKTRIPAGVALTQHSHDHAHLSILASGRVSVDADGVKTEYEAPACLTIPAHVVHSVTAITPAVWFCIWGTEVVQ